MFEMIWNSIIDHIPLWLWIVIIGLPSLAAFYYLSPILIPIWNLMPGWLKWTLAGIGAIFLAIMGGRYKGRKDAEEEERRKNADALKKRTEVDHDVQNLDNKGVQDKLRDWSRD